MLSLEEICVLFFLSGLSFAPAVLFVASTITKFVAVFDPCTVSPDWRGVTCGANLIDITFAQGFGVPKDNGLVCMDTES